MYFRKLWCWRHWKTEKRKERGRNIVIKVGRRSQIEENISERKEKVPYARGMRGGGTDQRLLLPCITEKEGKDNNTRRCSTGLGARRAVCVFLQFPQRVGQERISAMLTNNHHHRPRFLAT